MHPQQIVVSRIHSETRKQASDQFSCAGIRQREEDHAHAELWGQTPQQRGLPDAGLRHQREKFLAVVQAVRERIESIIMTGAEIQKTRICNHSEWILAQAVIVEKHYTNITIFTSPALG